MKPIITSDDWMTYLPSGADHCHLGPTPELIAQFQEAQKHRGLGWKCLEKIVHNVSARGVKKKTQQPQ